MKAHWSFRGCRCAVASATLHVVLACAALAQGTAITELGGLRAPPAANGSIDTNATFAIGMTTDDGLSWRTHATSSEFLRIVGKVRPLAPHIGQNADIYMVVRMGAAFLMRRSDGSFAQWSGSVAELEPYRQQIPLTAETEIELFAGTLAASGEFRLFLGYRGADAVLHYSAMPFLLTMDSNAASTAPWFFDGAVWRSNGTPPVCASPLLQAPVDLSGVTSILYPGQTRGGDYKAHGGFRFDGSGQTNDVTVVSAISGTVIRGERDNANGVVQYGFDIMNPCGVMMRVGHLLELSPKFAAIAAALPPPSASSAFAEVRGYTVNAGEPIATAIGLPGNVFVDFGIYDLRVRNPATSDLSGELKPYGTCWLDALPAADAARVRSLPPGDGVSGRTSDYCKQ